MNFVTTTLGRILFGLPFGIFGLFHFMNAESMKGMVPFPPQVLWVYITGLALVAASVSILINKKAKLASLLLGILLLVFVFAIHLKGAIGGDPSSTANLLKDMSLAGAAFLYSGHAKS